MHEIISFKTGIFKIKHMRLLKIVFFVCLMVRIGYEGRAQNLENIGSHPFRVSGGISLSSQWYECGGVPYRYPSFTYLTGGNLNISLFDFSMPFSFTYGSQEKDYSQPFNQVGLSPSYKWIKVHLGYRSMTFSQYTLSGTTFLGGGVELTPGKFRFAALYGRFNRKSVFDSLRPDYKPSYERFGYGMKAGWGSEENFFDVSIFKAKDDTAGMAGFNNKDFIRPAENLVFGLCTKFKMAKRLRVELEGAGSLFDRDVTAQRLEMPEVIPVPVRSLLPLGISSQFFTAAQANLVYTANKWNARASYQRVDPDYQSMGAAYMQTDIEMVSLGLNCSLWKRKIMVGGTFGLSHDNLNAARRSKTEKKNGSFNLAFNPGIHYGLNFTYSNYGISQKPGTMALNDSAKIVQNNNSYCFSNRYSFFNPSCSHTFNLMLNFQEMKDLNPNAIYKSNFTNKIINLGYFAGLTSGFSTGINLTYTGIEMTTSTTTSYGIALNAGKTIKKVLSLGGNLGATKSNSGSQDMGTVINAGVNAGWTFYQKHRLAATIYFVNNVAGSGLSNPTNHETRGTLNYTFNF
jgi:hypothetical protein